MGIKYIEDLSYEQFLEVLSLNWNVSEKIDGSFFEFGLDDDLRFFARRKIGQSCFCESDWPDEGWAESYRQAHSVAEILVEVIRNDLRVNEPFTIGSEIVTSPRHNTILYSIGKTKFLVITSLPDIEQLRNYFTISSPAQLSIPRVFFRANLEQETYYSLDGITQHKQVRESSWCCIMARHMDQTEVQAHLSFKAKSIKSDLEYFMSKMSRIPGMTNLDTLNAKLNKRPDKIRPEDWKHVKPLLKKERSRANYYLERSIFEMKDYIYRKIWGFLPSTFGHSSFKEGLVGKTKSGLLFKVVSREEFSKANDFSHIVKYWLIGGRRPSRPCFLSRTKDWPLEKRLERLEVLRKRFIKHAPKLRKKFVSFHNNPSLKMEVQYANDELYNRTLLLFATTRERLINGR